MAENVTHGAISAPPPAPDVTPVDRRLPAPPEEKLLNSPNSATLPPPHHKSHAWVWILIVIIIGVVITLPLLRRKKPGSRQPPPVTISTTNAARGNIDETVWVIGTVTPVYTANISPRVDGQLIKVDYAEGQIVHSNDLLAEIDPAPYQAAVVQGEGQVARDKAVLEGANVDLKRYQTAYEKKAIPEQQVADQVATVHQDEGTVRFDEGTLSNAEVQLAYCFVRAPFDGRAGLRMVDPGNIVHAANTNPIVVIAQLQPITVVFNPAEDYLPAIERQVQAGHKMTVEAWDRDQKQHLATGTFLTTSSLIDTSTGTIATKALFANTNVSLFPNQFVNVKLIVDTLSNVTLIPTAAIQRNPQGAFVYVVTNAVMTVTNQTNQIVSVVTNPVVAMRTITPGITDADITSVAGLEPGEAIATDNFNKLGDGMRVNLRQPLANGGRGGAGGKKRRPNPGKPPDDQQ